MTDKNIRKLENNVHKCSISWILASLIDRQILVHGQICNFMVLGQVKSLTLNFAAAKHSRVSIPLMRVLNERGANIDIKTVLYVFI